jgi:hypothetical protein
MTQNEIKKIEEKICKDGSLSEERKTELLKLLTTINPQTTDSYESQTGHAENVLQIGEHLTNKTARYKDKRKNFS